MTNKLFQIPYSPTIMTLNKYPPLSFVASD